MTDKARCKVCKKSRKHVQILRYKKICETCRHNPKVCIGCGEEKPAESFHNNCALCGPCRYRANEQAHKEAAAKRHKSLKRQVYNAYGNKCACCGETRETMLSIDHIENDGAEHRKALTQNYAAHKWRGSNIGGTNVLADIVRCNFPAGFQILCFNCNISKARNGGVCEHVTEGATTIPKGSRAKRPEAPSPAT